MRAAKVATNPVEGSRFKTVSVQLHTCPQYFGDGEAGGGGAAGAWRPQPAPSRRPGGNDIIEHQ